ncbi:hypothetical protein [Parahaliea aestuarii]|uniref:DUF2502 domain-containing protein n=1 Tax=Parahaliea aestuarii TaxID=1852021 RepID=A0A5C8ZNK7_9GAMM|nr:hypothetical protein [Parahaliea aestuarii]TXS89320.1 hypothetical protein FVW59_17535 [Parahaliea aestuarii]
MKHLLGILTLGALLAGASGDLLADDRHRGDRDRWHKKEHRDHHWDKHYRKHHAPPHWKKHFRGPGWSRYPGWHRHDRDRYHGAFIGLPGLSISLRHYHDGRACFDRHDHRHRH